MNRILNTTLTLLVLTLAACGTSNNEGPASQDNPSTGELPAATRLVIGTLKLDETEYAVTAEQAAELLPLWQVYQSLSSSDTAAQEEIDALIEQIEETMTPQQNQAIAEMQLTQEDVFAVMQEQGMTFGDRPEAGGGAPQGGGGGGGFTPPGGGGFAPPGGGAPGGGGGFPGGDGQGLSPDQIATAQAAREAGGAGGFNRTPAPLIEALIDSLKEKSGS
jgi:hypothetical protein